MSVIEFVVVAAASWMALSVLAASLPGCAYALGRFRARRARSYTVLVLSLPPVPEPVGPLDDLPVDCLSDDAITERFLRIPLVAADLRNAS